MSSSQRAERRLAGRVRHWLRGWSLRARLIAALVGLLAVVCAVVGVGSEVAVYKIQMVQLTRQVDSAASRAVNAPPRGPDDDGQLPVGRQSGEGPGLPGGTV